MPIEIPPEIQAPIAQAVGWLWDKYGQPAAEKAAGRVVEETKWKFGIEKYYTSLFERVGFVRILGRMESEPLENVFTHVNVLDKLTAEQRYDIAKLTNEFNPRDFGRLERVRRMAGDEAVAEFPKLFILGKPGAGKTTFLKHTALRAIKHQIKKVPLFVTLKELSDSGMGIVEFMTHQLSVHRFPEPEVFLARLLENGDALVLFDGLDEVNLEDERRSKLIQQINDFVYRYSDCPTLMTCRVAATDYSFTQFEYVEMADFDSQQLTTYIGLWFVGNKIKRENLKKVLLEDDNYKPVRELAQIPLLLALLCLVYDERNEIPPERHEIYEEAMRALLSKWDASRNISRDVVYQQLSLGRKQKMLATIAARTFEQGDYFLKEKDVVRMIGDYMRGVPGLEEPDAELVLQSLEAQHGIFVERARGIHSFSHLTLQEFFTARYIVDNESKGTIKQLIKRVGDDRWSEVFLLVAGMLNDATNFSEFYVNAAYALLRADKDLLDFLTSVWQKNMHREVDYNSLSSRVFLSYSILGRIHNVGFTHVSSHLLKLALSRDRSLARDQALIHDNIRLRTFQTDFAKIKTASQARNQASFLANVLSRAFSTSKFHKLSGMQEALNDLSSKFRGAEIQVLTSIAQQLNEILDEYWNRWNPYASLSITDREAEILKSFSREQIMIWIRYLEANLLLVRCLQVAYVPNRQAIEDKILLPPDMW